MTDSVDTLVWCEQCRYWTALNENVGVCKRYAPRPIPYNDVSDYSSAALEEQFTMWPVTECTDSCGDGVERS